MPTELKDMQVDFISLVSKGANGKHVIWKSGEGKPEGAEIFETSLKKITKSDEKRVVYGIVYSPDQVDTQGEFAGKAEIEKAAYSFMKGLRLLNVDAQHDFDPKAAYVAESWLVKGVDSLFPNEPEGSWAVGIRVEDDALWNNVKKGELAGLSMAGYASKVKKGEEGFMAKMEELLTRILKKEKGTDEGKAKGTEPTEDENFQNAEEVTKIAKALESLPLLLETITKFNERLEAIEKVTPGRMSKGIDDPAGNDGISFA
jgi:hypothetical protein